MANNPDKTVAAKLLPSLDWGRGIWQQVGLAQEIRKNCVDRFLSETDVFPEVETAESAIETVRGAAPAPMPPPTRNPTL
jgi:hypothetical protein